MILSEPRIRIDESAWKVLRRNGAEGQTIVTTVQSTQYVSCCGGYEEKSLKVQVAGKIENPSDYLRIESDPPIYMDRDACALLESRGNHLTVYADANEELYSDQ